MNKEVAQLAIGFLQRVKLDWNEQAAAAKVHQALIEIVNNEAIEEVRAMLERQDNGTT